MNKYQGALIAPPKAGDYLAGESPIKYEERNKTGLWPVPSEERQFLRKSLVDVQACVTFSALNSIESQIFFLTGKWMNFSDRFIAKLSGTTKTGNYLNVVAETIRQYGLVSEELWPTREDMTWDEYYAEIPAEIIARGQEFIQEFEIAYEWVVYGQGNETALLWHLKQAPLQLAITCCPGYGQPKEVPSCSGQVQHAVMLSGIDNNFNIFDHYEPFQKELARDYQINWALKLIVNKKKGDSIVSNAKIAKHGSEYGFFIPATTPEALISYGKNFARHIPHTDDHTVTWNELKPEVEVRDL